MKIPTSLKIATALAVASIALFSAPVEIPKEGTMCHLGGDTNHYIVVWVPPKMQVVNCLTNGHAYYLTNYDGPGFIGVSPTNDLGKLVIVPWPPKNQKH